MTPAVVRQASRAPALVVALACSGIFACDARSRLADHVAAYCDRLANVILDVGARGAEPRPSRILGFESWSSIYDRFVFCADARADTEAVGPLVVEFRTLVDALDQDPANPSAPTLARLRALLDEIRALPLKR